jgi:hypothetical protein
MPRQRPSAPRSSPFASVPLVADPTTRRAISDVATAVQLLQQAPGAVLVDGSQPPQLGDDAPGDLWYRDLDGKLQRLPIGTSGQVLTVINGLPVWS